MTETMSADGTGISIVITAIFDRHSFQVNTSHRGGSRYTCNICIDYVNRRKQCFL